MLFYTDFENLQMNALLGYVLGIVIGAVMEMDVIDTTLKSKVIKAFNKVIWIQNDLFARHYMAETIETNGISDR